MATLLQNSADLLWEKLTRSFSQPYEIDQLSWKLNNSWLQESKILWPRNIPWSPAKKWYQQLRVGFEKFVRVEDSDISQTSGAVLSIEFQGPHKKSIIMIDISDSVEIEKANPADSLLYYKMQFRESGYSYPNAMPGGYVPNSGDIYYYLSTLRKKKTELPSLFDVYGRFSLDFAEGVRRKALELLGNQNIFHFEGSPQRIRYSRYLDECSRSKVVIDLPGNGPFCFRLIDYLALGSCIVAPAHGCKFHVPLEHEKHIMFVEKDLSNLIPTCEALLSNDALRKELAISSARYFDAYLHRDQLTAYYLYNIMVAS